MSSHDIPGIPDIPMTYQHLLLLCWPLWNICSTFLRSKNKTKTTSLMERDLCGVNSYHCYNQEHLIPKFMKEGAFSKSSAKPWPFHLHSELIFKLYTKEKVAPQQSFSLTRISIKANIFSKMLRSFQLITSCIQRVDVESPHKQRFGYIFRNGKLLLPK